MSGPPDFGLEPPGLGGGDEFSQPSCPGARFGQLAIRMARASAGRPERSS